MALLAAPGALWAANPQTVKCDELTPCRLDGDLGKPIWRVAPVYDSFIEYAPRNGNPTDYKTSLQIAYDSSAIYVAIRAFDPRPDEITSTMSRHDAITTDQDYVSIMIDPIGNKRSAYFFRVSSAGATAEGIYTADTDNFDLAPDLDWDAITRRTPYGYTVEARIPFASLRYATTQTGSWRLMIGRIIPRDQRMVTLSVALPNDAPNFISSIQEVDGLKQPDSSRFVQIKPALTMRQTDETLNGVRSRDRQLSVGVDIKARLSANLVLDATLNPDFSQVEIDEPQLNRNVKFALATQEKRAFFLESSDLLQGPTSSVYTRTISDPKWGLRATLRDEAAGGTLFTARDSGGGLVLIPGPYGTSVVNQPSSQATVARGYLNAGSVFVNGLASARDYGDTGSNAVGGFGITWQMTGACRLRAQWMASRTTAWPGSDGALHSGISEAGSDTFLDFLARTEADETVLTFTRTGSGFRNDNGFVSQSGYQSESATYAHTWRNVGLLNEFKPYVNAGNTRTLEGSETITSGFALGLYVSGGNALEAKIEPHYFERTRATASGILHTPRYWHGELSYSPFSWAPLLSAQIDVGTLVDYDADVIRPGRVVKLNARMRFGKAFEFEPSLQQTVLTSDNARVFSETIARVLGVFHFNEKSALRLIVQSHFDKRATDAASTTSASSERVNAQSITFIHRRSSNTALYLGLTRTTGRSPVNESRSTELFSKLQFGL